MNQNKFDPQKHHRRSIRLPGYNYASPGAYYVTICVVQRQCLFGEIIDGVMKLNLYGHTVRSVWQKLPNHFPDVTLDEFIIMPNHIHGIISLGDRQIERGKIDRAIGTLIERETVKCGTKPDSLSAIIQNFKSISSRKINRLRRTPGYPVWQRNYYEHINRDEASLQRINPNASCLRDAAR